MTNIHASCVALANAGRAFGANPRDGVLLLGGSGAGKSDLALRLIAQGATLVADDRIELFVRDDALWVRAPAKLAGLIEVRGLGIVALPHAAEARVALVIRLVAPDAVPRLPPAERYEPPDPLIISADARPPSSVWRPATPRLPPRSFSPRRLLPAHFCARKAIPNRGFHRPA